MVVSPGAIKRLEMENELHKQLICGTYFWDFCRYPFYLKANNQLTKNSGGTYGLAIIKAIIFSFFYLLALGKKRDFLVIQHPRRQIVKGINIDIYTDRIVRDLKRMGFSVATLTRYTIHSAAFKETSFANLAAVEATSRLLSRLFYFIIPISVLPRVLEKCNSDLGLKFFDARNVRAEVINFLILRKLYLIILGWKRPKYVMLVVSAGHEALISACQKLSIPTIEVQHGSPGLEKLNYDYSNGCTKVYFPDIFLAHGRGFGLEKILPECKVIYFGCPFLDVGVTQSDSVKKDFDFLFISQPVVDEIIIANARKANKAGKIIGVRLHPNYLEADDKYRELEAEGVELVLPKSESLYETFLRSKNVVGCFSTALFEAIIFDIGIWIIRSNQEKSMSQLLDSGRAKIWEPNSVNEILKKSNANIKEKYFAPYNIQNFFDFLSSDELTQHSPGSSLKKLSKLLEEES